MPPTVVKQSSKPAAPKPVQPTKPATLQPGMKLAVYGRGKTGKTRLGATFPKPCLIIGAEDGTKSICTGREFKLKVPNDFGIELPMYSLTLRGKPTGIDFVPIDDSVSVHVLTEYLKVHPYRSSMLDHCGALQDILVKEVGNLHERAAQLSYGTLSIQDWGILSGQFKDLVRKYLALADTHGKEMICIAHEQNFTVGEASDVMLPSVGVALIPKLSGWLSTAVDYLGQTYIREETVIGEANTEEGLGPVPLKTGKKQFCLRVAPHEIFSTGFRVPMDIELPQEGIVNPTYEKISALIQGKDWTK